MTGEYTHRRGFTLIELLLATAIFAILAAALFSVFSGAMELREHAAETFAVDRPQQVAVGIIERDLRNMLPPAGVMAGNMLGENYEEGDYDLDTLEFYATTGVITENLPWGDLVHVSYYLEESEEEDGEGYDLIRLVERNLLASTDDSEAEEDAYESDEDEALRLLDRVASMDITYFDGETWQDSWDSTTQDNELPMAVSIRIDFLAPDEDERSRMPIEIMREMTCEAVTTEEAATQASGQTNSEGAEGGQTP